MALSEFAPLALIQKLSSPTHPLLPPPGQSPSVDSPTLEHCHEVLPSAPEAPSVLDLKRPGPLRSRRKCLQPELGTSPNTSLSLETLPELKSRGPQCPHPVWNIAPVETW